MGLVTTGRFYPPHSSRVLLFANVELTLNIVAAVVAYTFQPKKPALDLSAAPASQDQQLLLAAITV
jgi:hypothetical protein